MNSYLYDDTYISLIVLIITLIKQDKKVENIIPKTKYHPNLLENPLNLKLNYQEIKYYQKNISRKVKNSLYQAFLSNHPKKELIMYYFFKNTLKYQDAIYYHLNLNCVIEMKKICQKVKREIHHYKGFLRFESMENDFFYAKIAPVNNILPYLANHFQKRLKNENWLIEDEKRKIFALYNQTKIYFLKEEQIIQLNLKKNNKELIIEELWLTFYQKIAIKERENIKLMQQNVPKKYWPNMLERNEKNENCNRK